MNKVFIQHLDKRSVLLDYLFVIEELEGQRDILITQYRQLNEALQSSNRIIAAILRSQGGSVVITDDALISLKGKFEIISKKDPVTKSLQIILIEHE